jgi:peptidyl-prolyl cis-trans isomerase SurA
MKKLFLFFIAACLTSYVYSQTLFTYGNNTVSKDEFIRAYNKNKTAVTDKAMALREYLELYIKFKLKVKAAKDMRIDTLTSLATDLQNFRTQIEESYLNDESQVNALAQEAFNRSQKDVHVAYQFFSLKEFSDSASVELANKSLKANWKDIGFITVFSLPYEFENIVFGLKPGEDSHPYRAKSGYYIFKNVAERKALGKIKAAQILIAVPEDAKEEDKIKAGRIADSVYRALLNGADFSEAAKNVSNDKMTYMAGGLMPEFGVGKYDPQFEHTVFALQKDSDITAPFQTKFGYHIVKRLSITEIPQDKSNDSYLYTLKQQVLQDNRITSSKEKFINDVLKKLNYKKNVTIKENDLWKLADSFAVANKKITIPNLSANTILFSLNNQNIKVSDWLTYIKDYRASASNKGESSKELLAKYVSKTAVDNYKKRLPDLNPEFKYQLQEFKDGNILFEVMERNVWNKASNDSIGLKNYYNQHKTKYTWGESADAILISCSNEKTANSIAEEFKKGKSMRQIAEENVSQVQTDSGRYDLTQIPAKSNTKFVEGMITEPLINGADGTATFVKILRIYPANQQRSFEEARGLVINEYQTFLEEKWIEQLKKKYPVRVNEKIFQSLL